ncbi:DUF4410 domain-containing protein [Pseudomonas gingeri]|uniref:DUF4410 domain-containing protein n=1 Tax=Pseudomonas gingeri TaxID=117681 RepID=UPI0015A03F17|nr:DUF4410 domain-containing protein [Pseudomonas gingeri]NWA09682.1 DUF4410 domain-containing protein [Pseudomonas gingeri]
MKVLALVSLLSCVLLTGCAASVKSGGSDLSIPQENKANLVVKFEGNDKVEANPDWSLLKTSWGTSLKAAASSSGYQLSEQQSKTDSPAAGVLVVVNVSNFRYLSTGARVGAGIMVGNAWVNSNVDFLDLKSGQKMGSRSYNTTSSAWEGVMSAMTEKQVQAISQQIIADIKSAKSR